MGSINEKIQPTSPDTSAGKLTVAHPSVAPQPCRKKRLFVASENSQD